MTESSSLQGPLAGLRVLEIGPGLAISMAGMVLSDYGAQVVKIEPPEGDPARRYRSFSMLSRGKVSVTANANVENDRQMVQNLCRGADVVMVSLKKDAASRLGVDYEAVRAANPNVIYASVTGFGPKGPYADYADYEHVVSLKAGRGSFYMGQIDRDGPVFPSMPVASYACAQGTLQGIFAALHQQREDGAGHLVESSLVQGLGSYDLFGWREAQAQGDDFWKTSSADGRRQIRGGALSYIVAATADGHWLQFTQLGPHLYYRFMEAIGLEELFLEERFMNLPNVPPDLHVEVWTIIMQRLRERTLAEWLAIIEPNDDITAELFRSAAWTAEHPQIKHNGDLIEVSDPLYGRSKQLAPLVRTTGTPAAPRFALATLGEGNGSVRWEPKAAQPARSNGHRRPPLEGITVIEAARYYAAPFGGTLVADLGARVIKVESMEGEQPFGEGRQKTNQGKESIVLDMKNPRCLEIFYKLIEKADVFFHNFRPGVTERLKIDYPTLSGLNPRLIYLNATSYGTDGPNARKPAFDPMPGAVAGSAWRQSGGHLPPDAVKTRELSMEELLEASRASAMANWGFGDPASALAVGTAICAGIYFRDLTGRGQEMTTEMVRSNMYLNAEELMVCDGKAADVDLVDAAFFGTSPTYRIYPAGSETWVFLACANDEEWQRFCQAIGRQDLATGVFGSAAGRNREVRELGMVLEDVFAAKDAEKWEAELTAQGVACVRADGPPNAVFATRDKHMFENGYIAEVEDSTGRYLRHGAIVHVDGPPTWLKGSSPQGERTREILTKDVGLSEQEVQELLEARAIKVR